MGKRRDVGEAELKPRPSIVTAVLPCKDITGSQPGVIGNCPLKSTVWDHIPAKSIAVTDKKITSVKTKFKNSSKNILHKI